MAFDQPTRNRLQRFVTEARSTLEEEFTRQLQNDYGMDPASGTVAPLASLRHIDDQQRETARILRDTLAHYCAGADTDAQAGLDRIVREQAFTVLNRLAALRMAEARGLLIESVGNGYQAKGFQLYARLAGTGLGETGDAYRVYLQSVFDELSQDLPGLFDRFSPQGRLFPREAALIQVLTLINHGEIEPLWAEDETIGWIYQYFNSKEERKAMREASQAPRNSRELAVRNQFFTPRYVVEFLVDNTLGRLWFNWTGGQTGLRDRCQYLLVKPDTVVLGNMSIEDAASARLAKAIMKGQLSDLPDFDTTDQGVQAMIEFSHCVNGYDRDQSELRGQSLGSAYFDGYRRDLQSGRLDALTTQQIWDGLFFECRADRHGGFGEIYRERWFLAAVQEILARLKGDRERKPELIQKPLKLRDPRTIKLLDPACGSMHFGLYAFDLFLEIYREAWAWEQTHGPGCLDTETGGSADLKPLSQTYADQDSFLHDVPRLIIEHNIYGVDIDPRAAQIASLALWLRAQRAWHEAGVKAKDRPQVGQGHVVAAVAPPAEVDLRKRFMEELDPLDAELFEQTLIMLKGLPELGVLLQVEKELPALIRKVFGEHGPMFAKEDMAQWQKAETRLREALTDYASAARSTYQGRLFAEDALQGLRAIDLCREQFDVVVMNPPFGLSSKPIFELQKRLMPDCAVELYAQFLNRAMALLQNDGIVGAISSRSFLTISRLKDFRGRVIVPHLELVADLGSGVMDDAFVEAAAYTLSRRPSKTLIGFDLRNMEDSAAELTRICRDNYHPEFSFEVDRSEISELPNQKILYNVSRQIRLLLSLPDKFEPDVGTVRQGMGTFDDFRFLRLRWEVLPERISLNKWEPLAKGGAFSYYYSDIHLLLNWFGNGSELSAVNFAKNGQDAQVRQASDYWRIAGLTYSKRSQKGFSARALPAGCIIAGKGPAIISLSSVSPIFILGWINSRLIKWMIEIQANDHEYNTGILKGLPWRNPVGNLLEESVELERRTSACLGKLMGIASMNEVNSVFLTPKAVKKLMIKEAADLEGASSELASIMASWNDLVDRIYSVDSRGLVAEEEEEQRDDTQSEDDDAEEPETEDDSSPLMSWAVGVSFGRFDWCVATGARKIESGNDVFSALPARSPGMLPNGAAPFHAHDGILVDDQGHPHDLPRLIEGILARVQSDVPGDVRRWLQRDFFPMHLTQYSKSRRKAPIYWPLSTTSGSYTLWLYYPSLTSQTLYTAVNDFVEPKLKQVSRDAATLRDKGAARSRNDEKAYEALQTLELELIELRDTLLLIAPTYRPNHDDGVQITAAPLWQLFRHKPWQKILKDTWAKLEKGDYDWAHLAMAYWPDRVREKCKADKSLAIAHDLEHLFVEPEAQPKKARKKRGDA